MPSELPESGHPQGEAAGGQLPTRPRFFSIRLPLSAKILIWFFLNLTVLAVAFALLFNAQFHFDLEWVFASSARQRVDGVRALIVSELNSSHPDDWDAVIDRFSEAYNVRFSLFESSGRHLIGPVAELPEEVRQRIMPPAPTGMSGPGQTPARSPQRAFLRTGNPSHYWLLLRTRLDNPQAGGTLRVILVAQAESLGMGGLILDPAPWLGITLGVVVFSVLFWLPLLHGITRSIGQMTHTTRQIAEGRFEVRVATRRKDELGSLAESINQMAARLNGFVKGQKQFLGDIAHELCSPLARLQMVLGIMEQRAPEGQREYAKSAAEKAQQISALVEELLAFSRAGFNAAAVHLKPVEVREAVERAVRQEVSDPRGVCIEIPDKLTVWADDELLVRALANLIRNAIRHGGGAGPILLTAATGDGRVEISVADSGPGVPEAELAKLFDAFYRVDPSRTRATGGVGLGLTIVKNGIEACGGTVLARNRSPRGLEVILRLASAGE